MLAGRRSALIARIRRSPKLKLKLTPPSLARMLLSHLLVFTSTVWRLGAYVFLRIVSDHRSVSALAQSAVLRVSRLADLTSTTPPPMATQLPGKQATWAVPILYSLYLLLWTQIPYSSVAPQSTRPTNGHSTNGNGKANEKELDGSATEKVSRSLHCVQREASDLTAS